MLALFTLFKTSLTGISTKKNDVVKLASIYYQTHYYNSPITYTTPQIILIIQIYFYKISNYILLFCNNKKKNNHIIKLVFTYIKEIRKKNKKSAFRSLEHVNGVMCGVSIDACRSLSRSTYYADESRERRRQSVIGNICCPPPPPPCPVMRPSVPRMPMSFYYTGWRAVSGLQLRDILPAVMLF